tara:strand:+ start:185 stop:397 length:213 start_codon:yes stop_codon:yes gene_type:complete
MNANMKDINATKINNIDPPSTPKELEILPNKKKNMAAENKLAVLLRYFTSLSTANLYFSGLLDLLLSRMK